VLYGPAHEAVLRYARRHVRQPGRILDVGCGTGRLAARLVSAYRQAQVAGVDASTEMIRHAAAVPHGPAAGFAAGCAEELPFADAVFGLVVVTLSMSHWRDAAAGLGEIRRVMHRTPP
jgi:ubiquinone/menaquinone biosynthesis C-methylase UbiE